MWMFDASMPFYRVADDTSEVSEPGSHSPCAGQEKLRQISLKVIDSNSPRNSRYNCAIASLEPRRYAMAAAAKSPTNPSKWLNNEQTL